MTIGHNPTRVLLAVIPCIALLFVVNYTFSERLYPESFKAIQQRIQDREETRANYDDSQATIDFWEIPDPFADATPADYVGGVLILLFLGCLTALAIHWTHNDGPHEVGTLRLPPPVKTQRPRQPPPIVIGILFMPVIAVLGIALVTIADGILATVLDPNRWPDGVATVVLSVLLFLSSLIAFVLRRCRQKREPRIFS